MSTNINVPIRIDLKPFKEGLAGALTIGQEFSRQFHAIAKGLMAKPDLSALEHVFDQVQSDLEDVEDASKDTQKSVKDLGDETEKTGKKGTKANNSLLSTLSDIGNAYRGARQAAMDMYRALEKPVSIFTEFQSGMTNTNTMLRLTKEELRGVSAEVLNVGKNRGIKSLTDLTKGFYDAVSAGRKELEFLDDAALSAKGGSATFAESINFGTGALNAWSLATSESTRVFNVAFRAVERGKTNFAELANNIGAASSTAASANIPIEEVMGAIATLTKSNVEASTGFRYMRGTIIALNKVLGDGWTASMTFQDGLNRVREMAGGSDTKLMELLGSQEAYAFTLALTGEKAKMAAEDLAFMYNEAVTAQKAYEQQIQNDKIKFWADQLVATFNAMIVNMVEYLAPAISGTLRAITGLFSFVDANKDIMLALAATIGTATAATILYQKWSIITAAAVKAFTIIQSLHTLSWNALKVAILSNPIGTIITVLVAIGATLLVVVNRLGGWSNAWAAVKLYATASIQIVWDYIKAFGLFLFDFGKGMLKTLNAPWYAMYEVVKQVFSNVGAILEDIVSGNYTGALDRIKTGFVDGFKEATSSIKNNFSDAFNQFNGLGSKAAETWDAAKEAAKAAVDAANETTEKVAQAAGGSATPAAGGNQTDSDAERQRLQQLREMRQAFDLAAIEDEYQRKQKEIEIAREAALAKARELKAEKSLLDQINRKFDKDQENLKAEHQDRINDVQFDFEQKTLNLAGKIYDAQLNAVDRFYEDRKAKLLAAGLSEQQIEEQKEAAKQRIRDNYNKRAVQGASKMLGDLAKGAKAFGKKGFATWKRLAQLQALVDTYAMANAAFKSMADIPVVGFALGVAASAAAIVAGLANVAQIEKQKFATGGFVKGKSHAQGGELIEVEGGEHVTRKSRVAALGRRIFDFLNNAPLAQVQAAIGNMMFPSIPVPATVGGRYADGGVVGGGLALNTLIDEMRAMRGDLEVLTDTVAKSRSVTYVAVDSALGDAVKISEAAEEGDRLRSRL